MSAGVGPAGKGLEVGRSLGSARRAWPPWSSRPPGLLSSTAAVTACGPRLRLPPSVPGWRESQRQGGRPHFAAPGTHGAVTMGASHVSGVSQRMAREATEGLTGRTDGWTHV